MTEISYQHDEFLTRVDSTPIGIVRQLVRAGFDAYIVGGAVRDLLLGHTPKDYDISTSATPEQVRHVFGRRRCRIIGRRFRLAHVYMNGEIYEVSTFRRKPSVAERQGKKNDSPEIMIWNDNCFGTLQDDAGRRDFTCNSLYLDVARSGDIIDLHHGLEDIRNGVIRCIGNPTERMEEDPVRMLRALKLVATCGFTLEKHLTETIRIHAQDIRLSSPARLFEELLKILNSPKADEILKSFHINGFLKYFWPTLDECWEEQEGVIAMHLLTLRGRAIRRGGYSDSRGLALSTVCTPFMMLAINPEHPQEFWDRGLSMNDTAKRVIAVLFDGFLLPHLLELRMLDIIGMLPRLMEKPVLNRYLNHKEYRYSRAILALLVEAFGWEQSLLADLPEFSPRLMDGNEFMDEEQLEQTVTETPAAEIPEKSIDTAETAETAETAATAHAMVPSLTAPLRSTRRTTRRISKKTPEAPAPDEPPPATTQAGGKKEADTIQRVVYEMPSGDKSARPKLPSCTVRQSATESQEAQFGASEHAQQKKKHRVRRKNTAKKESQEIPSSGEPS